ncbi:MAG: hypothetical protein AAB263_03775 [Planctomycetota bacterium]
MNIFVVVVFPASLVPAPEAPPYIVSPNVVIGLNALNAPEAVVWPVPPLAIGNVDVTSLPRSMLCPNSDTTALSLALSNVPLLMLLALKVVRFAPLKSAKYVLLIAGIFPVASIISTFPLPACNPPAMSIFPVDRKLATLLAPIDKSTWLAPA